MRKLLLKLTAAFLSVSFIWAAEVKITAGDAQATDFFGHSVSISGDYAIVGAHDEDPGGVSNAGAAYAYLRNGVTWSEKSKTTASDAQAYDYFGCSVSISGDYAIVGAYGEDPGSVSDAGAAYIYESIADLSLSLLVSVTITNGANGTLNFQQTNAVPPESNWLLGQFSLAGNATGAILTSVSVMLGGAYDPGDLQSTPFQLYASNSNDFSGVSTIGSSVADPGSGSDVTFSSLNDAIPSGTRYYWVTTDISAAATADDNINGTVDVSGDLSITDGTLSISSNYGKLNAGNDASLPVELASFTATAGNGQVTLKWTTESEIDNEAFIIERGTDKESFELLTEIKGQGSTSSRTDYSFTDNSVFNGFTYYYRLADRDINGVVTYHPIVNATPNDKGIEFEQTGLIVEKYALHSNYPNPFNPETTIRFDVPTLNGELKNIKLTIYNSLGQLVSTLYEGQISGGKYEMKWNGTNSAGMNQPSGVYFLNFQSDRFVQTQKMILMR